MQKKNIYSPRRGITSLEQFLVNHGLSQARSGPLHPGDEVAELLDGLYLLPEELALDEVAELVVVGLVRKLVEVEQRLENQEGWMDMR